MRREVHYYERITVALSLTRSRSGGHVESLMGELIAQGGAFLLAIRASLCLLACTVGHETCDVVNVPS